MLKDRLTTEYDDMDIDSILSDFHSETVSPADPVHDADGDGEYEYGQILDTEEELSYEEYARLMEERERREAESMLDEDLSYEEYARLMEEREAQSLLDEELSYEEYARLMEEREAQSSVAVEEPEEEVRPYEPNKSRRQQMAEEALDFMANVDMESEAQPADEDERRREWEEQVREFYGASSPAEEKPLEFDSRFNLSGKRENRYYNYDGQELDLSAEEGYVPAKSHESISHWAGDEGLPEYVDDTPKEKRRWGRKKKKKEKRFDDSAVPPPEEQEDYDEEFHGNYSAPKRRANDENYRFADEERIAGVSIYDTFPSFTEFYLGEIMGILYRIRFSSLFASPAANLSSEVEEEPEMDAEKASRYYGGYLNTMKFKLKIAYPLMILLIWLGLGLPIFGALRDIRVAAAMSLATQLTFMLLNLDIVTNGILSPFRRRFGAETLVVAACLITSIDALSVVFDLFGSPHRPLTMMSSLSLFGLMLSAYYSAKGLRKSLRVSGIAELRYSLTAERGTGKAYDTLLRTARSHEGFVRRSEEMPPDEALYIKIAPMILIFAALLTLVLGFVHDSFSETLYVASAILSLGAPASALLCFSLPFCIGSFHIFRHGAAIAGWSGACDIGKSERLIITDRDLFPSDCIKLGNVTLIKNISRATAISYAGTLLFAADTCTAGAVLDLMEKNNKYYASRPGGQNKLCSLMPLKEFEVLSGGGFKGIIDGHVVLLGGMDLMKLMNIKLMHREMSSRAILLAVDGKLVASFEIEYSADTEVRNALTALMRSNNHPIFAVRDFNINPQMLRELFDLPTDGYDFPPYSERFKATDTAAVNDSPISAVICREGLKPLVRAAETGRSIYTTTRLNLWISALSALVGMLLVFAKLVISGTIGAGILFAFALLFTAPVFVLSIMIRM